MGKNKDIKLLHEVTGLSYKECRARMKRHSWNYSKALFDGNPFVCCLDEGLDKFMKAVSDAAGMIADAVNDIADALAKAFKNVDFEKLRVNKS